MWRLVSNDVTLRVSYVPLIDHMDSVLVLAEVNRRMAGIVAVRVECGDSRPWPYGRIALDGNARAPFRTVWRARRLLGQWHAFTRSD